VLPAAIQAAHDALGARFGNPSSSHAAGLRARALLDDARSRARRVFGAPDGRLMFTSGATEGIQTAVLSSLCAVRARRAAGLPCGDLLLYGATEHKAVPESLAHWNRVLGLNLELTALAVDADGQHDLVQLRALAPDAALVCTMAANNETGVVSDLDAISAVLADTGSAAYWLVDCVQALGKLALNLAASRIDYAPFSGHKLYAPKGTGMLYVRAGAPFTPLMMGGGQEGGQRSGTENMAGIAALGAVLDALERGDTFRSHAELAAFRERLATSLRGALPGVVFNAPFAASLPTTLNFSVPGLSSRELLDVFDAAGVRVSSGSACSAAKAAPSYVLEAMQVPRWRSEAAIRMSFGPLVDEATIAAACGRIERCGAALRGSGRLAPGAARDGAPSAAFDGLLQFGADGHCSWLLADAGSRSCVVIDPQRALNATLVAHLQRLDYRVRAVLQTGATGDTAARIALLQGLDYLAPANAPACPRGWPRTALSVVLGDGRQAPAMQFGQRLLAMVDNGGHAIYLAGQADAAAGALRAADVLCAFGGTAAPATLAATLIGADTLWCTQHDEGNLFCTTRRAEQAAAPAGAMQHLAPDALAAFLAGHPRAILVDVRESFEHAAGAALFDGRTVLSVPLAQLPGYVSGWLAGDQAPLVFLCRSGNRSGRAAACLQRLGHRQAFSVSGGMALGGRFLLAA
jgi:cysteine sulfinate desulfinase/cysteine desulfurase-like protein/rhodanese-related sulfurtransferase